MVITISLNETTYYKEDYVLVGNKVWLNGQATGLNPAKRYALTYTKVPQGGSYHIKNNNGENIFVTGVTSFTFHHYSVLANIPIGNFSFDSSGYASMYIEMPEVNAAGQIIYWGASNGKYIIAYNHYSVPPVEYCDQFFTLKDQNGNNLSGFIAFNSVDIPVSSTGQASVYTAKGVSKSATAYYEGQQQTKTFTTCTTNPIAFTFTPSCIPNWQCELPLNKYESDGCGNRRLNSSCNPPVSTILTMNTDKTEVVVDEQLNLSGKLTTSSGTGLQNARIQFKDELTGQLLKNNNVVIYVDTDNSGNYNINWTVKKLLLNTTLKLYAEFLSSGNYLTSNTKNNLKVITIVYIEEEIPTATIGDVTYVTEKDIFDDEIIFTIPVTNTSSDIIKAKVKLFNELGKLLSGQDRVITIAPNQIGNLTIDSKGDSLPSWGISDVQGKIVTLKLYAAFDKLITIVYDEIASIEFTVDKYSEESILTFETDKTQVNTGEAIIFEGDLVDGNNIAIPDAEINFYWQKPGVPDERLKNIDDIPLSITTDINGHYSATWKSYNVALFGDMSIKLIAKFTGDDIHNKDDSDTKDLTIIRTDIIKENVNLSIYVDGDTLKVGDELKISGRLSTLDNLGIEHVIIEVYATGGILKNYLQDRMGTNLFSETDVNGNWEINWIAKQMDKDETVEIIAKYDGSDNFNAWESLPITVTLTDVEEDLVEQDNCFISNPLYPLDSDNPCIISDSQASLIKYAAIGIGGLYALSVVAPIIKSAGKFLEKKSEEK